MNEINLSLSSLSSLLDVQQEQDSLYPLSFTSHKLRPIVVKCTKAPVSICLHRGCNLKTLIACLKSAFTLRRGKKFQRTCSEDLRFFCAKHFSVESTAVTLCGLLRQSAWLSSEVRHSIGAGPPFLLCNTGDLAQNPGQNYVAFSFLLINMKLSLNP